MLVSRERPSGHDENAIPPSCLCCIQSGVGPPQYLCYTFSSPSEACQPYTHCYLCALDGPSTHNANTLPKNFLDISSDPLRDQESGGGGGAGKKNSKYGNGQDGSAQLNFVDCAGYALARSPNLPLLFKGRDFVHTDIVSAVLFNI